MNADITVVVPYYNEKETIEYTMEQVGKQTLPAKCAVFVNSSSTDDTFNVVSRWIQKNQHRFSTQFKNIYENTCEPGSSKNAGIRHADTEWVAFMDCGQKFQKDWLERQYKYALKNKVKVVSGIVSLDGENWVDRCAVSQTYGYKRERPCVPTSLIKKNAFEEIGLFLEGRRAGYDIGWMIKLKKSGLERSVNKEVKLHYIGVNFSSSLSHLYRKSVLYAESTVGIEGYPIPYLYIVFLLLGLGALAISGKAALIVISCYFLMRSFFIPLIKSRSTLYYKEHPFESLFGLGLVGFVLDLGRLKGTLEGIWLRQLSGKKLRP